LACTFGGAGSPLVLLVCGGVDHKFVRFIRSGIPLFVNVTNKLVQCDGDAVAVAHECFSSPVAAAAAPASTGPVDSPTTWLPVPLRCNLRATANRYRPLPPAPSSRGPCPDPSRNYARSGAAPTPTQTVTAAIPSFFRMDILLAGTLFSSLFMEFLCRVIVQRRNGLLRLVL
jgi:hypothetical protein